MQEEKLHIDIIGSDANNHILWAKIKQKFKATKMRFYAFKMVFLSANFCARLNKN